MRQCVIGYPLTTQTVAYTDTAGTITNAVDNFVNIVRVLATSDAFIKIGKSPTATTSDVFVAANVAEYFKIKAGEKVSAIQSAASGTLYVTEMTQ